MIYLMARRLALPISLASRRLRSISGRVAQIVAAVMLGGKIRVILCGRPIGLRHCPLGERYFSGVEKITTAVHEFAVH
jgi:hypothetical protein